VKANDLRTLDGEELSSRLRGARRELYELRFKLAVGQLDDHRQIRKVRKDIARILTVVHIRRLGGSLDMSAADLTGMAAELPADSAVAVETAEVAEPAETADGGDPPVAIEETPENVETPATGGSEPAPPRRGRRRAADGVKKKV